MKRNLFAKVHEMPKRQVALLADPVMIGDPDVVSEKDEATLDQFSRRWCEEQQDTSTAVVKSWKALSALVITRVSCTGVKGDITSYTSGAESRLLEGTSRRNKESVQRMRRRHGTR